MLVPAALAAAALIAVIFGQVFAGHAPTATAHGPEPLPFAPVEATTDEIVTQARAMQNGSGVQAPKRESRSVGWYASISMTGSADLATVAPENTHLRWAADGSGDLRVTAGAPYTANGAPPAAHAPPEGTLLREQAFDPGGFIPRSAETPGTTAAELEPLLDLLSNGDHTEGAADHITGIEALLLMWTLTDAQHAALLEILQGDGDAVIAGTTTDRAGRPAVGLRATSHSSPWLDSILLVSTETGRIIAVEQIYTGQGGQLPIPAGTVISYTLWEV